MRQYSNRSDLLVALIWIACYCFLQSLAFTLNDVVGIRFSISTVFAILQVAVLLRFLYKNNFIKKYGLCFSPYPSKFFIYYLPLYFLSTVNLWNGVTLRYSILELLFYISLMLCVGFLEEVIFRGLLFQALAKSNVSRAMIISSVTFGIGHLINSFNGSGLSFVANLLQISAAIAFGFLFVTIFHRGKSLLPCICTHSAINIFSAFSSDSNLTAGKQTVFLIVEVLVILGYIFLLFKTSPSPSSTDCQ